jgi:hypothetical protein
MSHVESAVFQWEEGYRQLEAARSEPRRYRALGRMVTAIQDELRKRLGSTFSVQELASLYYDGTDWGLEVAIDHLADEQAASDTSTGVDAAFYLYMRESADFAGGSVRQRRA